VAATSPTVSRTLRRVAKILLVVITLCALAGATYQGVATALERRRFPLPGRLVDIGGRQLHMYCTGEGTPTVVLEAGATSLSVAWALVQPEVARATRVCSYDRAGLGWSEAGDRPFNPMAVPDDLRRLLDASGERAPHIVVGHGLGAAYARLFAGRYADQVAALILVDPPTAAGRLGDGPLTRVTSVTPWLARTGLLRAVGASDDATFGLPDDSRGPMRSFLYRPDHLTRAGREIADADQALSVEAQGALGSPPQVVVLKRTPAGALLIDPADVSSVVAAIVAMAERERKR
jgi:pimeloyl-ACP methyl ester carboxylesterase